MKNPKIKIFIFIIPFLLDCYYPKKSEPIDLLWIPILSNITQMNILFIGDSLAERSNTFGLQETLGSNFTLQSLARSGWDVPRWEANFHEILQYKPNLCIIGLGTNDANNYPTSQFPKIYNNFASRIQTFFPKTILLHTLPPPTELPILKSKIKLNNSWILENYNEKFIVDLFTIFENNSHLPLYPTWDPVHPNPIGYDLIRDAYRERIIHVLNLNH